MLETCTNNKKKFKKHKLVKCVTKKSNRNIFLGLLVRSIIVVKKKYFKSTCLPDFYQIRRIYITHYKEGLYKILIQSKHYLGEKRHITFMGKILVCKFGQKTHSKYKKVVKCLYQNHKLFISNVV